MANPALIVALKKIGIEVVSDPEKAGKNVLKIILIIFLCLILFLFIPINFLTSVPVLLIDTGKGHLTSAQQKQVETYQSVIEEINQNNLEWIEQKKKENSNCDDIVVNYDYTLKWEYLLAIHTALNNQDFSKISKRECLSLGNRFIEKSVKHETYTVWVEYTYEDEDGEEYTEWEQETRRRAIITVKTKTFDQVLTDLGVDEFEFLYANNVLSTILGIGFDIVGGVELEQYPEGYANLPYYNQGDARWGNKMYGMDTIRVAGCGPTALAMVVSGMTGQRVYPDDVAKWSVANGHRAPGAGSYWSLMTAGGRHYGLKVSTLKRTDPNGVLRALSQGKSIVVSMGRGHFTKTGHFIVLRGLNQEGKVLVHDPNSVQNSEKAWDIGIIMNESSTNGGVEGSPFFVFSN